LDTLGDWADRSLPGAGLVEANAVSWRTRHAWPDRNRA
jgi:hypothetical protein